MIPARFVRREQHGAYLYTFWFEPERKLRFTAGQFTELTILHAHADNRGQTRQFSISSAPQNRLVGITASFPVKNPSSFKQAMHQLNPGDTALVSEPMGDFVLPKSPTPAVFIAGGVGITPVLSIAQSLQNVADSRPIHVIHAARDVATLLGPELFSHTKSYHPFLTQPTAEWNGAACKLTATTLTPHIAPDHLFYISGPEHMVANVTTILSDLGVAKQRIITDIFLGI